MVVAAAEEERFTRKKHDTGFPAKAIRFCMDSQGIKMKDVDVVAFYEKPLLKFERVLFQHFENFPKTFKVFLKSMPSWINQKLRIIRAVRKLGYKRGVVFVRHHMAHAASAFFPSPFKTAAVVTIDGVGEWSTTTYGIGEGNSLKLLKEINFPHSLGLLYSTITAYLGFKVNNSEYKVMGLSAYGDMKPETNVFYSKLRKVIDIRPDGSYGLDMAYFDFDRGDRMPSQKLCDLLGGPLRKSWDDLTQRHKDIAAALQMVYEEATLNLLKYVARETGMKNLVMAGGSALNSLANGKILKKTPFKKIWIQPNASDGGTSLGAALHTWHTVLGRERIYRMTDAYLGPCYSNDFVKAFLDSNGVKYTEFKTPGDLIRTVSRLLFDNEVVGWFQGRMEWGPRALGSRSILANPCNPHAQDVLNLKVKHREKFRPFAPVVCEDDALKYFECDRPVPEPTDFMLMVYPIRKRWHRKIPSVTHVDGSGRLQTVRRHQNPDYYNLIKAFGKLSGIPLLINTSFNIRGEPIVCTPFDAYKCMMGTGIDYLAMGRFLIKREDNPQHMWDSEKYAKD